MKKVYVFDFALQGKQIKLIHTNDLYTYLKPGDTGTMNIVFKTWTFIA